VRTRLELATDPVRLNRLFVAVPRHSFDADSGDVAAETAESLDKGDIDPGSGRCKSSRQSGWARTDHENVGLVNDVDLSSGLSDGPELATAPVAVARVGTHGLQYGRSTHLLESVHVAFTPRSLIGPLSVNFDLYGDQRCSSPTKEKHT
jgi:hypothetical protein